MAYRTSQETQKRKDLMAQNIINSALRVFARKGYACTTIKEIVNDAGTSVGNFYFYFKNKEEVFKLLYDEMDDLLHRVSRFAFSHGCDNVVAGFCRSKTSELWVFQNIKGFARVLMIEAAGSNSIFEKKRSEILNNANSRIEPMFCKLKQNGSLDIDDARISTLLCNGTMYSVIMDWLQGNDSAKLTDYAFPIVVYNLNAFRLDYSTGKVMEYIKKMTDEMEKNFSEISKGLYINSLVT